MDMSTMNAIWFAGPCAGFLGQALAPFLAEQVPVHVIVPMLKNPGKVIADEALETSLKDLRGQKYEPNLSNQLVWIGG